MLPRAAPGQARSRLGLGEVNLESTTREGVFGGGVGDDAIHAAYRVIDGYNPSSVAIPVARAQGITSAVATPRDGLISGTSGWVTLIDSPGNAAVRAPLATYANLGEAALDSAKGSRGLALVRLREVLDDARQYNRQKRNYERNQSRAFAAGRLDLEALIPVVQGRIPLVIRANRASDIRAAIALNSDFGQLAGMAVARGMTHEQALAAITTAPARLFGVARGVLKPGQVADVVVWSGDPFELSTRAEHVIIGDAEQSTQSRQDSLFERYRTVP